MSPVCSLCSRSIADCLRTEEHIIPNAIGGQRTVSDFICRPCNSRTGHDWDNVLNKGYELLGALLRITRDRGKTPPRRVTLDGKPAWITSNGSFLPVAPSITEVVGPDGKKKKLIQASSMEVAREFAETLRGTVPDAAIDKGLAEAASVKSYPSPGIITFSDGFDDVKARSAVKTALAFAHSLGISSAHCESAVGYLRDDSSTGVGVWNYFTGDVLPLRAPPGVPPGIPLALPLHIVAVQSHLNGALMAYVEYFGFRRLLICLSSTYDGPPVRGAYIIEPVTGQELPLVFDDLPDAIPAVTDAEVAAATLAALGPVMGFAHLRDWIRERDRVLDDALAHAFAVCGADPSVIPDAEMTERLKAVASRKMKPWLEAQHLGTVYRPGVPPLP